jgi:uridine kinase
MAILERVGTEHLAYIEHDAYYRNLSDIPHTQGLINFDHPDALETSLLIQHIQRLKAWQPATIPVYDFTTYERTQAVRVIQPQPIILVEGILVFAEPDLRECFDVRIFVDTDSDLRFIRRLTRDLSERGRTVDSVVTQYLQTVRPMHLEFVEPSKRYADVIIPEGGKNLVAIEMVASRIRSLLDAAGHAPTR